MATYAQVVERAINGLDAIFSALKQKGINIDPNAIVPVEKYPNMISQYLFRVGDLDISDLTLLENKIADYTDPGIIELNYNKSTKELSIDLLPGYYNGHITLDAKGNIGDEYTGSYSFTIGIIQKEIYDKYASMNEADILDASNDADNNDQLNTSLTINTKDKVLENDITVELGDYSMGTSVAHEVSLLRSRVRGIKV